MFVIDFLRKIDGVVPTISLGAVLEVIANSVEGVLTKRAVCGGVLRLMVIQNG